MFAQIVYALIIPLRSDQELHYLMLYLRHLESRLYGIAFEWYSLVNTAMFGCSDIEVFYGIVSNHDN